MGKDLPGEKGEQGEKGKPGMGGLEGFPGEIGDVGARGAAGNATPGDSGISGEVIRLKKEKRKGALFEVYEGVVSKETVVLRRWGSSIQKFWFYQRS